MMIKAVVFDLDGTLLDTLDGLKDSTNYALRKFGYKEKSIDEIRIFVGNGVVKLIERVLPNGKSNPNFNKCFETFKQHYSANMQDKTKPYPKIIELLKLLREKNIKIGVVSNKYDEAVKFLCKFYFENLIDFAVGESSECKPKPEIDGINLVLDYLDCNKDEIYYVGDSEVDVETAQNANVKFIAVGWGFRNVEQLQSCGAKIIINSPVELLKYLD